MRRIESAKNEWEMRIFGYGLNAGNEVNLVERAKEEISP